MEARPTHTTPGPVRVVDTTLRDGQLSLWATRMSTGMMLPVAERLDGAGFDAIEIIGSSFFKVCVRLLREDPWERLRLVSARVRRTPLRAIKTRHISAFQPTPPAVQRLWMERLAASGVRQVRISDPSNTVDNLRAEAQLARRAGIEPIINLIYSVSPKHTDAYYAARVRALGDHGALHLCLKDPSGLLTPERTRSLVRILIDGSGGGAVELHTHCNTGLGPLCCLEALREGAAIVDTAVPPLANGASQPSVFNFMDNVVALGYRVDLDREALRDVERHFRRIAERDGLPEGRPVEYDVNQYRRQVPGGMVSNLRSQLRGLGMEARLEAVLEEMVRVRAEFGHPIMVTPYAQYVVSQAWMNVVAGERYREVTDDVIRYALGHWGHEEAQAIAPDVRDRIVARSRAAELAAAPPADLSIADLRRHLGAGTAADDDELLLRYLVGDADVREMRRAGPIVPDMGGGRDADAGRATDAGGGEPPLAALLRGLSTQRRFRSISVSKGDFRVGVSRAAPEAG